jgi:hypothetical protein
VFRWILIASVVALPGCAGFAPAVEEPLRVGTLDDLRPEALGLQRGITTSDEARMTLRNRGLTGMVEDAYVGPAGKTLEVLAADYQRRVHVFVDRRYSTSLELPTHGLPPYGLAVRFAARGTDEMLLVLYRDPLARAHEPPVLVAYTRAGDEFRMTARSSFAPLVARHRGMTRPMLVGNDLDSGIMLVARERDGTLWDTSYLVRFEQGEFALQPHPMTEAMRCACLRAYAFGETH